MAKVNGVRWYGHVLRRDDGHVLRKVLELEVRGKTKSGRPKKASYLQVEKESRSVGVERKDTMNRVRCRMGVREIAAEVNPFTGVSPGQNWNDGDDDDFAIPVRCSNQLSCEATDVALRISYGTCVLNCSDCKEEW